MELPDNALRMWFAYFLTPRSTLTFGGDHAEMEITEEAREALDALVAYGAVMPIPPTDSWPGREYYGATDADLRDEFKARGIDPFNDKGFVTFRKKHAGPRQTTDTYLMEWRTSTPPPTGTE
jgi:hypothetical protein